MFNGFNLDVRGRKWMDQSAGYSSEEEIVITYCKIVPAFVKPAVKLEKDIRPKGIKHEPGAFAQESFQGPRMVAETVRRPWRVLKQCVLQFFEKTKTPPPASLTLDLLGDRWYWSAERREYVYNAFFLHLGYFKVKVIIVGDVRISGWFHPSISHLISNL